MLIAKNDEAKRSRIWRMVTLVSSVLIILVAIYLLTKMFTTNPLEDSWEGQDGGLVITIRNNGSATVVVPELQEDTNVSVKMKYSIDKDEKTVTFSEDEKAVKAAADASDGKLTEDMVRSALSSVSTTFAYSVDQDTLTLTEREYGEQMVFTRK